jgi:hypothetical protein
MVARSSFLFALMIIKTAGRMMRKLHGVPLIAALMLCTFDGKEPNEESRAKAVSARVATAGWKAIQLLQPAPAWNIWHTSKWRIAGLQISPWELMMACLI